MSNFNIRSNYLNSMTNNKARNIFLTNFYNKSKGRWNNLYIESKLQKIKKEKNIAEEINKREKNLLKNCTFHPKLNKGINYEKMNFNYSQNYMHTNNDNKDNLNLNARQKKWIQSKEKKLVKLKEKNDKEKGKECKFIPDLKKPKIKKENFHKKALQVVVDPESFDFFVNRMVKKRKDDKLKYEDSKKLPGSGYLWNNRHKKFYNDYDYTKHELSMIEFGNKNDRIFNKTYSNKHKLNKTTIEQKPIINEKDEYYDYIYKRCTQEKNLSNTKYFNNKKLANNSFLELNRKIEYGKALEILHTELINY